MSVFQRLKAEARYDKVNNKNHCPYSNYAGGGEEIIVLPEKPKKKQKLMEVQRESKKTLILVKNHEKRKGGGGKADEEKEGEIDDEEMGSDNEGEKDKEPKKIPWGPPEILEHLHEPGSAATNVNFVIANLKKSMNVEEEKDERGNKRLVSTVWDHSQSNEGKKSDNNFFMWFEAMGAEETRKVMAKENLIYE